MSTVPEQIVLIKDFKRNGQADVDRTNFQKKAFEELVAKLSELNAGKPPTVADVRAQAKTFSNLLVLSLAYILQRNREEQFLRSVLQATEKTLDASVLDLKKAKAKLDSAHSKVDALSRSGWGYWGVSILICISIGGLIVMGCAENAGSDSCVPLMSLTIILLWILVAYLIVLVCANVVAFLVRCCLNRCESDI